MGRSILRWVMALALVALALGGGEAVAGKPGGGGGGGTPNTTPLDILVLEAAGGQSPLYAVQDDGTGVTYLATVRGGGYAWSPDGTKAAFYYPEAGDESSEFGIYVMDVPDGTPVLLVPFADYTDSIAAGDLDWSPVVANGVYSLAFTMKPPSGTFPNLENVYVARFDADGLIGDPEQVTAFTDSALGMTGISWSYDGSALAVAYRDEIRIVDLAHRDAAGKPSVHTVYTSTTLDASCPAWAKTQNRIAFCVEPAAGGRYDLVEMDVSYANGAWAGSALTYRTATANDGEMWPSWSPDDARIAFTNDNYARKSGKVTRTLQVITRSSGARTTLATSAANFHPVWKSSTP